MDPQKLIQDGYGFASKAITNDQNGQHKLAHFFYVEASEAILNAIALDNSLLEAKNKAYQYIQRAEVLQNILNGKFNFLFVIGPLSYGKGPIKSLWSHLSAVCLSVCQFGIFLRNILFWYLIFGTKVDNWNI